MISEAVYEALTGEDDGRVCRDIPDEACNEQPRNFLTHVAALAATKTGDGLVDPKLVLSWLLGALGAPALTIGLLVPVREAGALLPQLFAAAWIRALPQRKWVWAAGSLMQALSLFGMAAAALSLTGAAAGWAVVAFLAVFAVARSACSVSYKDVLGKTVSKTTRGTATGTASTVAAAAVLTFGLLLSTGIFETTVATVAAVLAVAGLLWAAAALVFATLPEVPGATEDGGNALDVVRRQVALLWEDPQLALFIATRGLLTATALAPPYLLALTEPRDGEAKAAAAAAALTVLGPLVLASALAGMVSTYVWGRLSDTSSRKVLALSAGLGAIALAAAAAVGVVAPQRLSGGLVLPVLLFALMIAYQGVRIGRSTHLVDMADASRRASYTALSNTAIGLVLVAGGAFGVIADVAGPATVLSIFAAMCAAAAGSALALREVQD